MTPSIQYKDSIKAKETELSEAEAGGNIYSPKESIKPQENIIWNQYNIMYEGWKAQLTNAAQIHTLDMMKMMGQVNTSLDNYTKLYLCTLSLRHDRGMGNTTIMWSQVHSGMGMGSGMLYLGETVPFSTGLQVSGYQNSGQVSHHMTLFIQSKLMAPPFFSFILGNNHPH